MTTAFALLILLLSLLAWIGQLISAVAPRLAERLTLTEPPADVDPTYYQDVRAECAWDAVSLWPLTLAAVLLLLSNPTWAIFGLLGGGMYIYFAGRGIAQRVTLRRRGIAIGKPSTILQAFVLLALWGAVGIGVVALASHDLLERI
jgi:hypothetical protein